MAKIGFTRRQVIGKLLAASALVRSLHLARAKEEATDPGERRPLEFGTCVVSDQIEHDRRLRQVIADRYTYLTPEYQLQWQWFEPAPNSLRVSPVDAIVAFAQAKGMRVHGHSLLWEEGTPSWVRSHLRGKASDWDPIRRHFSDVLTRYGNDIRAWNVVNEPIATTETSDGLRANSFLEAFGPDYVRRSLETAREFAPKAELLINDYSLEYENPIDRMRRTATLKLVERLRQQSVPLDGFGLQGHLDIGKGPMNPKTVSRFVQQLADFGLRIYVTELDVQERDYSLSIEKRDQKVADETRRFLDIVLDQPAVAGITTWGTSDKYSWLKPLPEDLKRIPRRKAAHVINRGLPFDVDMNEKPMFGVLEDALADEARTSSLKRATQN